MFVLFIRIIFLFFSHHPIAINLHTGYTETQMFEKLKKDI